MGSEARVDGKAGDPQQWTEEAWLLAQHQRTHGRGLRVGKEHWWMGRLVAGSR
jgi:hypothetical protein